MNKIYKIIWSKVKHCYVVASELAKRNGKGSVHAVIEVDGSSRAGSYLRGGSALGCGVPGGAGKMLAAGALGVCLVMAPATAWAANSGGYISGSDYIGYDAYTGSSVNNVYFDYQTGECAGVKNVYGGKHRGFGGNVGVAYRF